ncbi:glycosyltransferase [Flavobacterium sp.]|uniref:glycosyltransferase family 4 protein n=1 Tax=Flavobacterium sp. TaxID=239 RepID=UPI00261DB0D1|nr:glycosyltransferase [Flavobacterium sp.]
MTKKILYIGNKLAGHGQNPTTIDTLSVLFAKEGYRMVTASSQKNKILRIVDMVLTVLKHARSADFVIIDTYSTFNFWYAFLVSQVCRILRLKYIPYLHGGDLPKRLQQNPRFCRMIFDHAYKNVAPSAYLIEQFRQKNVPRLIQIPNLIERERYTFKQRNVIKPHLLWVRAFAAIYNPKMAVDVAASLQKIYPETTLCMVGPDKDGSLDAVKDYAGLKKVAVRFTGQLSKTEWTTLAAGYDIFMATSHFDNMPVSVMEAMALGLPVVATNVGGIPFLLRNDVEAQLVADGDVEAMVAAIRMLIENPDNAQKQIGEAYRKVESFDWKEIKKQWKLLFEY